MTPSLRLLVAASVCVLASLALPTAAHAHTELVSSTPAAEEAAPLQLDHVVLTFSGDLVAAGSALALRDARGREVVVRDVETHGSTVDGRITLETPGRHTLGYRVVGQDGHPIVGELTFTVGASGAGPPAGASARARLGTAARGPAEAAAGPSDVPTRATTWWIATAVLTGALVLTLHRRGRRRRSTLRS